MGSRCFHDNFIFSLSPRSNIVRMNEEQDEDDPLKGYARLYAAQPTGSGAELVTIETDLTRGLHSFSIVGLADKAMEEAKDRVSAAIRHTGYVAPKTENKRIVLALSPADLKKEGSHFDLGLALCYLMAAGHITVPEEDVLYAGELSLDGSLRAIRGTLPQVIRAKQQGFKKAFVPPQNAREAALVHDMEIYAPETLRELVDHLEGKRVLAAYKPDTTDIQMPVAIDIAEVKGQESAKRALLIAATGGHNLVFYGPPGTGKTMLARTLPGILPLLTPDEMLEVTSIHSTAGMLSDGEAVRWPPFRAPHHTISHTAMVGGGAYPRAGEVTLAHRGVLFMDEFPEFDTRTLEALRQPLEDRVVTVARTRTTTTFPARCMLVAAMNPADTLSEDTYANLRHSLRQAKKISRPIVDRLDIWVEVPHLSPDELAELPQGENSEAVRSCVETARAFGKDRGTLNAHLSSRDLEIYGFLSENARDTLRTASKKIETLTTFVSSNDPHRAHHRRPSGVRNNRRRAHSRSAPVPSARPLRFRIEESM